MLNRVVVVLALSLGLPALAVAAGDGCTYRLTPVDDGKCIVGVCEPIAPADDGIGRATYSCCESGCTLETKEDCSKVFLGTWDTDYVVCSLPGAG